MAESLSLVTHLAGENESTLELLGELSSSSNPALALL
jgi:hypothetical protein